MDRSCQTVVFNEDWPIAMIFRSFSNIGKDSEISQEDLIRDTGLNLYALRDAIQKINESVKDSILSRPENEGISEKIIHFWFAVDDLVLWKGKFTINDRKAIGYKLADNISIIKLSESKVILRVYKNGN